MKPNPLIKFFYSRHLIISEVSRSLHERLKLTLDMEIEDCGYILGYFSGMQRNTKFFIIDEKAKEFKAIIRKAIIIQKQYYR